MTTVTVFKNSTGKLAGWGAEGGRAYAKFLRTTKALENGDMMTFSFALARSPKHHKFFFWKLRGLFKRQEQFTDEKRLREWLTTAAGYCTLMPGPDGSSVAIPDSLEFDAMEESEFTELHSKVNDFLWTERAQTYLWPHLNEVQRHEMVDGWHKEFDATKGKQ
jgi:hypothetical protein